MQNLIWRCDDGNNNKNGNRKICFVIYYCDPTLANEVIKAAQVWEWRWWKPHSYLKASSERKGSHGVRLNFSWYALDLEQMQFQFLTTDFLLVVQLVCLFSWSNAQNVKSAQGQEKPSFDHQPQCQLIILYSFLVFLTRSMNHSQASVFPYSYSLASFFHGNCLLSWPAQAFSRESFGELPQLALVCNTTKGRSGLRYVFCKDKDEYMQGIAVHETKVRFFCKW